MHKLCDPTLSAVASQDNVEEYTFGRAWTNAAVETVTFCDNSPSTMNVTFLLRKQY